MNNPTQEQIACMTGEQMQQIIESYGMELQMLRQLIMTAPLYEVETLLQERKELDKLTQK